MSDHLTVLHLAGSPVDEFHAELSRVYAAGCFDAIADPSRFEFHIAYVCPGGTWKFPSDFDQASIDSAESMSLSQALIHLDSIDVDVMVPQMFCIPGMTAYRGLFDVLRIPYVGNLPDLMAIAADKARTRAIVAAAGVPIPAGEILHVGEQPVLATPVVVKPVAADNSMGVSLVRDPAELDAAVAEALRHGPAALVESYIELGREVRCGIIVRDGELIALPLEEYAVDETTHPIRGRDDKLSRNDDGDMYLVAKDSSKAWIVDESDPITQRVWDMARMCHAALGARHYSLFDFRIDPQGNPWFLEAGLYCSYSPSSVVAVMAASTGIGVDDLFASALQELSSEGELSWRH